MECSIQLNALRVVGRYAANWTEPPKNTDTQMFSDAPMIGNGDVGVVIGGTPDSLHFYLGKSEFISLSEGAQKAMSRLILSFPQMEGASYHARQMISSGKVRMTFQKGTRVLALTSWIQATDTTSNLLFIRMWMAGEGELEAAVTFQPGRENKAPAILFNEKDLLIQDVSADEAESVDGEETVKVRCAARLVGGQSVCENHELAFTLRPKDEVTLVVSMMSNLDSADYKTQAVKNAEKMTPGKVDVFDVAHENWW